MRNLLLLFSFFLCQIGKAQDHIILDKFDLYEGEERVYVRCIISSGSICNGIKIYRSEDTLSFNLIGEIPGVCGNISSPVGYDFIDEFPIINKKSYYKLELGGYGFTKIRSIFLVDTKAFGFQVRPNPAKEKATIFFENNLGQEHILSFVDLYGNTHLTLIEKQAFFEVDLSSLNEGWYIFSIENLTTHNQVIGKLFVLK